MHTFNLLLLKIKNKEKIKIFLSLFYLQFCLTWQRELQINYCSVTLCYSVCFFCDFKKFSLEIRNLSLALSLFLLCMFFCFCFFTVQRLKKKKRKKEKIKKALPHSVEGAKNHLQIHSSWCRFIKFK